MRIRITFLLPLIVACFTSHTFAQKHLELGLRLDKGAGPYREGERFMIQVTASAACYAQVVYHDAAGESLLIFPNAGSDPQGKIVPGKTVTLGRGVDVDGFEFTVTAPFGAEMVSIYAGGKPLPLPKGERLDAGVLKLARTPDDLDVYYHDAAAHAGTQLASATALLRTIPSASDAPVSDGTSANDEQIAQRSDQGRSEATVSDGGYQKPRLFGLVVGVSRYESAGIRPLRYAETDARSVAEFLADPDGAGVPPEQLRVLLNENATRDNILAAFKEMLSASGKNDMVIIYFAGHGITAPEHNASYFLSTDADLERLPQSAVDQAEITSYLTERVRAGKIVFFIDACHGGGLGLTGVRLRGSNTVLSSRLLTELVSKKNGTVFLTASRAMERSQEGARWGGGHGVFTHHLVSGLRGSADLNNDGKVTIDELGDFVGENVKKDTGGLQHPELKGYFDNDLVLSVLR